MQYEARRVITEVGGGQSWLYMFYTEKGGPEQRPPL